MWVRARAFIHARSLARVSAKVLKHTHKHVVAVRVAVLHELEDDVEDFSVLFHDAKILDYVRVVQLGAARDPDLSPFSRYMCIYIYIYISNCARTLEGVWTPRPRAAALSP